MGGMKIIRKNKGAISIFLCIVLTAMIALSGLLVDGARIRVGETEALGAAENATRSALASYDRMLKDLYGIFALNNSSPEALNAQIEEFINKTLMTELGLDKKTMGEKGYNYLKSLFVNQEVPEDVNFLNMFDYAIEEVNAQPIYNLAQHEVLANQIVQYMKYRAPKELAEDFLDKLEAFKQFGKQSGTMKKKIELDKELDRIKDTQRNLLYEMQKIKEFDTSYIKELYEGYSKNTCSRLLDEIDLEVEKKKKQAAKDEMDKILPSLNAAASALSSLYASAEKDQNAISSAMAAYTQIATIYNGHKADYEKAVANISKINSHLERLNALLKSAKENLIVMISDCIDWCNNALEYIYEIEKKSKDITQKANDINNNELKDDNSDFANQVRIDVANNTKMADLKELEKYKEILKKNKNVCQEIQKIINANIHKVDFKGSDLPKEVTPSNIHEYISSLLDVESVKNKLKEYSFPIEIDTSYSNTETEKKEDLRKDAKKIVDDNVKSKKDLSQSDTSGSKDKPLAPQDSDLVSKSNVQALDFSKEDKEYVQNILKTIQETKSNEVINDSIQNVNYTSEDIESILGCIEFNSKNEKFSSNGLEFLAQIGNMLEGSLESLRDSIYINEYAIGTFKNALTDKSFSGIPPQLDLSGAKKSDRSTYYNSEIEYILTGAKDETVNNLAIQGQILLIRFALNTIAIYMDPVKVNEALAIATAAAGWTVLGVPLMQTLILMGWAMAESVVDVKFLLSGKEVPIYKTKGQWYLDATGAINQMASNATKFIAETATKKAEDITTTAKNKIDEIVEKKIDIALEKVFAAIEEKTNITNDSIENVYSKLMDDIAFTKDSEQNSTMSNIEQEIAKVANELFNTKKSELETLVQEKLLNNEVSKARDIIKNTKVSFKEQIITRVSSLSAKIKGEVDQAVKLGAEKLTTYIDEQLDNKKGSGSLATSLKASILSMNYNDYLRLFLIMKSNKTKVLHIADLMQLNMRKVTKNNDFKLENCNTYIRLNSTISMKYLFMTGSFIPNKSRFTEHSRYKIDVLLYQGY